MSAEQIANVYLGKDGSFAEAVKQVAGNDRAIAYVDKSAVDASVKAVLRID